MKQLLITLLFLSSSIVFSAQTFLEYNIHYKEKNIYVQNPFTETGLGFCVDSIEVNNLKTTDTVTASAFQIDLSKLNLDIDEVVNIKIFHQPGCLPKILNINYGRPRSTFNIDNISLDSNGIFKWSTTNEQGKLTYIIEQYRWNKWIKVGEKNGKGMLLHNEYIATVFFHSGLNKFRVKQIDYSGKPRISKTIEIETKSIICSYSNSNTMNLTDKKIIEFGFETLYELFDKNGNMIKKGKSDIIDCSDLKKGIYYLNYDNHTGKVINIK